MTIQPIRLDCEFVVEFLRTVVSWVHRHRVISFLFALVVFGFVGFWQFVDNSSRGLWTEPVQRGKITEAVYGIGTVLSNRSYKILATIPITLTKLFVKEGDTVNSGAELIQTDYTVYKAPFRGTITYLPYKIGENIPPHAPTLTLVDLNDRYLVVSLEQQGALRIRKDQKVTLSFDSLRESKFYGIVQAVYSNESNFLARIKPFDLPPQVLPGMTADVAFEIQVHDNSLLVPIAALEEGSYVWKENPGSLLPKKVKVQIGIIDQSYAEVISDQIHEKDKLLIRTKAKP